MSDPLITIMIPTYNQPQTLKEAIESARNQTYGNIEIVISDDASPDKDVSKLLQQYEKLSSITINRNPSNIGRVANYHSLLYKHANGVWIVNLDGDDYFQDPSFIEKAVSLAKENPSLVMISGRCLELTPDGKIEPHQENSGESRTLSPTEAYTALYDKKYLPFHGSTLYKRDLAREIGFYKSDTITSDFQSLLKFIQAGDIGVVKSQAVVHRTHESNASVDMSVEELIDNAGVFFAPLDDTGNVPSQVSCNFLRGWVQNYAYREGRAIAYRILKKFKDNTGYRAYLRAISRYSKKVAFKIMIQPKNILKYLHNALA